MTFQELKLKDPIQSAIRKAGYEEPSPIQEQAIPEVLAGKDLLACAQTGTGKTAAFALPILNGLTESKEHRIRALILTPTRELAIQIFDNFKMYGRYMKLRTACVYGGVKPGLQLMQLEKGCDILIATPGRLMDFMADGFITLEDVGIFVLDEADRMLDMGFIRDVRRIAGMVREKRQTLLFSATMPKEIEGLARELLKMPVTIKVAPTTNPADTVTQSICFAERAEKKHILGKMLHQEEVRKSIVFTRTKYGADKLVKDLAKEGITSLAIHGDKSQGQRQNALERFKSGNIKVLIATDVASRGIDVPKITHVFNYELPEDPESYIHRIGRSGRAGETGKAVSLCCEEELERLYEIEKMMKKVIPEMEAEGSIHLERKPLPSHKEKASEQKASEHKNTEQGSVRTKTVGQRPLKQKNPAQRPMKRNAVGQKTEGQKITDQKPMDQKSASQKPMKQRRMDQKPADQKFMKQRSVDQKSVDQKSMKQRSVDQRPADQKSMKQRTMDRKPVNQAPLKQGERSLIKKPRAQKRGNASRRSLSFL